MPKRRISKKTKIRLSILGTLSLVIIITFFVNLITYTFNISKLCQEEQRLQNEFKELQAKEQNLKIEIQKLKDPEYVARYARENYLYSKDGEYIIKLDPPKNENKENNTNKGKNKDIIYIISGLVIILVIPFLKNKRKTKKTT